MLEMWAKKPELCQPFKVLNRVIWSDTVAGQPEPCTKYFITTRYARGTPVEQIPERFNGAGPSWTDAKKVQRGRRRTLRNKKDWRWEIERLRSWARKDNFTAEIDK